MVDQIHNFALRPETLAANGTLQAWLFRVSTFLAEVGKIAAHNGVATGFTYLGFVFEAVDVAVAGAEGAVRQLLEAKLHTA